jgi:Serine aminopeptidase, S33
MPTATTHLHAALSAAMLCCLLALLLVATVDACAGNKPQPSSAAPPPGEPLTKNKLNTIARKIGGDFGEHLSWMANSSVLFTFNGKNDLPLQGYYLPNAEDKAAAQKKGKAATNPVIVFCAGWSETSLKYAKFVRVLNNMGYSVFSFDLRGQGFSSPTGYDKGLVTHVKSFSEYVDDLDIFMTKQVMPKVSRCLSLCIVGPWPLARSPCVYRPRTRPVDVALVAPRCGSTAAARPAPKKPPPPPKPPTAAAAAAAAARAGSGNISTWATPWRP